MADTLSKINVYKNDNMKWEAEIEYKNDDGEVYKGETQTFDDFSQASAWVAGIEVDLAQQDRVEHEADDLS